MRPSIDELLSRIHALEDEVEQEYVQLRSEFSRRREELAGRFVELQRRQKVGLWRYLRGSRLSVVLTFVVVLIAAISLFSHKLGLERGLSVALFPMVILTMTIERLSITWEERGGGHAMKVAIGTLFAASLAHLIMTVPELVYFVFTFPAILLILVGFMLAMGRYRGYRLTELVRFKAFVKADS